MLSSTTVVVIILASIHTCKADACSNGTPAIFYRAPIRSCSYLLRHYNGLEIENKYKKQVKNCDLTIRSVLKSTRLCHLFQLGTF